MIDRTWLETLFCLGGGDRSSKNLDQLCQELGEQSEVLPYLLLMGGSFADWPAARTALRTAARSVTRPTQMRVAHGARPQLPALRRDLHSSLGEVLTVPPSAPHDQAGETIDVRVKAADSIARFRAATGGPDSEPHAFIPIE